MPCTLVGILVPVLLVFIPLEVGLIVLAVGLGRAGVLPYRLALVDVNRHGGIAGSLQYPVALVFSGLALVTSFGFAGLKLLRTPSETLSVVGPV